MKQLTVTNQQELDTTINERVCTEILLDGEYFTLPTSDKIHALTFVGTKPQTTILLTGTQARSRKYDPKEHKVPDYKPEMVNQFDTVFSAKCKNLNVTAAVKIELYFQLNDEFKQWQNVSFDRDKINIVILEDEINSFEEKEKAFEIKKGLKEIGEMTVEFLEDIQESFTNLIKAFK